MRYVSAPRRYRSGDLEIGSRGRGREQAHPADDACLRLMPDGPPHESGSPCESGIWGWQCANDRRQRMARRVLRTRRELNLS